MGLTAQEEASLFGSTPAPKADEIDWDDEPKELTPPPKPKAEPVIMPECPDCGTSLNPENASRLKDLTWKHIGCPKTGSATGPAEKPPEPEAKPPPAEEKKPRGRSAKIQAPEPTPQVMDAFKGISAIPVSLPPLAVGQSSVVLHVVRLELGQETLQALRGIFGK